MLLRLDKHNRYHILELVLQPHFYIIILTIIMTIIMIIIKNYNINKNIRFSININKNNFFINDATFFTL